MTSSAAASTIRPIVTADDPLDVRAYQAKDPEFPTHGTHDQLYTDEKFESYRALGHNSARRAMKAMRRVRIGQVLGDAWEWITE